MSSILHNRTTIPTAPTPNGSWTFLIEDVLTGSWRDPDTNEPARGLVHCLEIAPSLDGKEAELIASMGWGGGSMVAVTDQHGFQALGQRVVDNLKSNKLDITTLLLDHPEPSMVKVDWLEKRLRGFHWVIAIGSGALNDLCKLACARAKIPYCVFPTAASMNGYTSSTASITDYDGMKKSIASQPASGVFIDINVGAAAPSFLAAAGWGDCLCRSVAQTDWWLSHRLLDTFYSATPFLLQHYDEEELRQRADTISKNHPTTIGLLYRLLSLTGLGTGFTKTSHHMSMGEHQVSHYIDCFAPEGTPRNSHGAQVGVASLTLAAIQQIILQMQKPPLLKGHPFDRGDMERRMGEKIASQCWKDIANKMLTPLQILALNERLERIWPKLREETSKMVVPVSVMHELLTAAGAPTTYKELGLTRTFYKEAVVHALEMRNRFSFLDLAAHAHMLHDLVDATI